MVNPQKSYRCPFRNIKIFTKKIFVILFKLCIKIIYVRAISLRKYSVHLDGCCLNLTDPEQGLVAKIDFFTQFQHMASKDGIGLKKPSKISVRFVLNDSHLIKAQKRTHLYTL